MRWSQKRLIAAATISLLLVASFLSWNRWKESVLPESLPTALEEIQDSLLPESVHEKPLSSVLQDFIDRPILSYDEAVRLNSAGCPTEGVNYDEGTVTQNDLKWRAIPSTRISTWRHDIAAHLQEKLVSERSAESNEKIGRGIVMAAGDTDAVIRARTNVRLLRSYDCTLPVEIFHFSSELSATDIGLLSGLAQLGTPDGLNDLNVTVRVVEGVEKGLGWKAFEIKGAAIQQSSFDEILYLDTDSYLLRNPEHLFESTSWSDTGLLLWPDYTKSHATNPIWRLLGLQCRDEFEGESGQIIVSRSRHQDVLWLVEYFAVHHEVFYGFMGGDRDSFRIAALLLDKKWSGPGRLNAAAGSGEGGGHTMLQSDPEGKWMFVHANLIKHAKFQRPLWQKVHRAAADEYDGTSTYGNIEPPNEKIGLGVKLRVAQEPRLETYMNAFEGYDESLVVVDDWDVYEELRGFEEKWFRLGGVH